MRTGTVATICFVLLLASCPVARAQTEEHQAFLPLAGVQITVADDQVPRLVDVLGEFGEAEHLRVDQGNFPKSGRFVINMSLKLNDQTFFHVDNFNEVGRFELNAYSHEKREVWQPIWDRLIQRVQTTVGAQNVREKSF